MLVLGCHFAATVYSSSHRGLKFECYKSTDLGKATVLFPVSENAPCNCTQRIVILSWAGSLSPLLMGDFSFCSHLGHFLQTVLGYVRTHL